MAQIPEIRDDYVGDGTNRDFTITFEYLKAAEVFLSVDGVNVPYVMVATSIARADVAPAAGAAVRVYRSTAAYDTLHVFDRGVPFLPRYIDENNTQLLMVAQEAIATSGDASATADEAEALANTAIDTADAALTNANAAVVTAGQAVDTANAAVETANTANANSAAAQSAAAAAQTSAADAQQRAASAETRATQAEAAASNAVTVAEGVDAKATEALSKATTAESNAATALTTANAIDGKATTALSNANAAVNTANAAQATANGVDAKATEALSTAGTANSAATSATNTANEALSTANAIDSKAQDALNNSNAAVSTANTAQATANGAVSVNATQNTRLDTIEANLIWGSQPIGVPIPIWDHMTGVPTPPTNNAAYRYIKLTASDSYNSGVLTSEAVSGSAPLVIATAVINDASSPINGRTVQLINTERRVLRAGSSGTVEAAAMQGHLHTAMWTDNTGADNSGQIWVGGNGSYGTRTAQGQYTNVGGSGNNNGSILRATGAAVTDNTNGTPVTANETRAKSIGATFYMRIR